LKKIAKKSKKLSPKAYDYEAEYKYDKDYGLHIRELPTFLIEGHAFYIDKKTYIHDPYGHIVGNTFLKDGKLYYDLKDTRKYSLSPKETPYFKHKTGLITLELSKREKAHNFLKDIGEKAKISKQAETGLPKGWTKRYSESGRPFYFNFKTGYTQWTEPS